MVNVLLRHALTETVRPDVPEFANHGGIGVEPARQMSILDQALDQVLKRSGPWFFVAATLIDVSDDVLQYLSYPSQCHVGVKRGYLEGFARSVLDLDQMIGKSVESVYQRFD
jgi:hypothetical protein